MATTETRQEDFGAGEISPSLHGASRFPFYESASRGLRNLIVSKHRTLLNRAGTVYCGEIKDSSKLARLLRFDFSDDQSYAIEAGDKYFRLWGSDGAAVVPTAFLAIGTFYTVVSKSTDKGATWASATALPVNTQINGSCEAGNGRLVAVGVNTGTGQALCYVTDDGGATWVQKSIPTGASSSWYKVAYNGRTLVAVGSLGVSTSTDNGNTWSAAIAVGLTSARCASWGNDCWIIAGDLGGKARFCYSYDGATWSAAQAIGNLDSSYTGSLVGATCFLAGQFILVGSVNTGGLSTAFWARLGLPEFNWSWGIVGAAGDAGAFLGIATDGSVALAVGQRTGSTCVYKYDQVANTWTALTPPTSPASYSAVTYSREYFVLVGAGPCSRYDGSGWTADPTIPGGNYTCISTCIGTQVLELVTPYASTEVAALSTVQCGDIVTMFHRWFAPRELRRHAAYDWRLQDWYKAPPTLKVTGVAFVGTPDQVGDALHPPKEWQWVDTWEDAETGIESLVSDPLAPPGSGKIALYPDKPSTHSWTRVDKAVRYHHYRGRNGEWGYVGTTAQPASVTVTCQFRDDGQIPIYSESPPTHTNPFQSDLSYPRCGVYFDDRFMTGGSMVQPSAVIGSAVADYYDFDENFLTKPSDSIEFTLACRRFEEIRWMVALERLIVGTSEGEWVVGGAGTDPLSNESILARERSARGSQANIQPVVVGDGVLYVQAGGKVVRDFAFESETSQWGGKELTTLAQHLTEGYTIVDWAYCKEPHSVVWLVRSDGALLSLTFQREYGLWAWARHDTGNSRNLVSWSEQFNNAAWVKNTGVTVTPNADTDPLGGSTADQLVYDGTGAAGAYRVTQQADTPAAGTARTTSLWMRASTPRSLVLEGMVGQRVTCALTTAWQRFQVPVVADGANASALAIYSPVADNAAFTVSIWGGQMEAGSVATEYVLTGADAASGGIVEAVTSIPDGQEDVLFLIVKRTINGATKRYVERMATRSPASATVGVFLDCALTVTMAAGNTVSGLSHLEARTVGVLADGTYRGTYTVTAGSITFTGAAATVAIVGLPITADFESLDYPPGRLHTKVVARVGVEFRQYPTTADTAAGIYTGEDLSHLGGKRLLSDAENGAIFMPVESSYNPGARCAVRHTEPFPLEIRGITREVVTR